MYRNWSTSSALRCLLGLSFCLGLYLASGNVNAANSPNIVLIMIDDLGWMDLACQGNKLVETPRIDELAQQGIRFTDAYAAAPVCSPTRAAHYDRLVAGEIANYQSSARPGAVYPKDAKWLPAEMHDGLSADYTTIAERLKAKGYATGFLGKWHLAGKANYSKGGLGDVKRYPEVQGFDLNIGGCALGGPPSFFSPFKIHNIKDREAGEYLPDRMSLEAIDYIDKHQDRPFFLCLWNYTVHWPMEAPEALLKKYETSHWPWPQRYALRRHDRSHGHLYRQDLGSTGRTKAV